MVAIGIIYIVDQSKWTSPMIVQLKKQDPTKLRICFRLKYLNKVTLDDPFPMHFIDEIINEVEEHECYSFIDRFPGYNQVYIAKENQHKTTFVCEFGFFSYKVMSFGLKNAPEVLSRIVVKTFQEYLYKTMAVYFDDWMIYYLIKVYIHYLRLMPERCR